MNRRRQRRQDRDTGVLVGRLVGNSQGYGFVILEQAQAEGDVFIPASRMNGAADGDQVRIRLRPRSNRKRGGKKNSLEGEIVGVLSRANTQMVGKIFRHGPEVYVVPLQERYHYTIRLVKKIARDIPDGQVVAVNIVAHPGGQQLPLGELCQVLGDPEDPETQYRIVCFVHGIPLEFSPPAKSEAEEAVEPDGSEHPDRRDLREWLTITIDGESARDFDDAVSIRKREEGGFELGVHIADVSHYVTLGGPLDSEARLRGTSVYFPDRAIPMLPERLSNLICSLKPGVDRLAVSVLMELDVSGRLQQVDFCRSVIRSRERMTYTQVRDILNDRDPGLLERFGPLVEALKWMLELSQILSEGRRRRGALDFDLPEPEVQYRSDGTVADIVRSERNQAHRIIEEFMLLTNETVARYLEGQGCPFLYRVHEDPDEAKVEDFLQVAARFGYRLEPDSKGGYPTRSFQKLMSQLEGRPEQQFLSYLMLRSFKQAHYTERKRGHFGLASDCYTHFTSPIRRYPDLVVHRLLTSTLDGKAGEEAIGSLRGQLSELGDHSSEREREGVLAEREIVRWIMVRFMAQKLGEEFEAFITGVRKGGFFVELLDHFVEGYVPVTSLTDDSYHFHEKQYALIGKNTRRVFRIGDGVKVRVDRASPEGNLVELSPVSPPLAGAGSTR